MRSRISRLTLLVLAGLVVAAGACGGDDDDSSDDEESSAEDSSDDEASTSSGSDAGEEEYVAAILESMEAGDGGFGDAATDECVAGVYVDVIGLETLQATISPEEIAAQPEAQPEDLGLALEPADLWDGLQTCLDVDSLMLEQYSGGDPTITECMLAATTEDQRKALFVAFSDETAQPDPAVLAPIETAATQCGAPVPGG